MGRCGRGAPSGARALSGHEPPSRRWAGAAIAAAALLAGCTVSDVIAERPVGVVDFGMCVDFRPLGVGDTRCPGQAAEAAFRFALCSCEGLSTSSTVETDAFDSREGPYTEGRPGGAIGTQGRFAANAPVTVGGALWVAHPDGIANGDGNRMTVGGDLRDAGDLRGGEVSVTGDAEVGGDVVLDRLSVARTLRLEADATFDAAEFDGELERGPVAVPVPCACGEDELLDVAGAVAAQRVDNDNAALDLAANELDAFTGDRTLSLGCGRFYLSRVQGIGALTIRADTPAALFIDGDLAPSGPLNVELGPGGTLDLFVAGNIVAETDLRLGQATQAGRVRLYVGGAGTVQLSAGATVAGHLYAPRAEVVAAGELEVFGSLFVRRLAASGPVSIHYDESVRDAGVGCGGEANAECASCDDCRGQACLNGRCGECVSDGDCCAPLACVDGICG